jgi:hypothetical protein
MVLMKDVLDPTDSGVQRVPMEEFSAALDKHSA